MSMRSVFELAEKQGYPARFEDDLICNKCGEPWDTYGVLHGDMTSAERDKFLAGGGCPSCPIFKKKGRIFRADINYANR